MNRSLLAALAAAALAIDMGAAARFSPRRYRRVPYTGRPASAFGARYISGLRGGAEDDGEDDFWEEEIRRTKAFYDAPQTTKAKEILINGKKAEVENAGEEEAFEVEGVMTDAEDETVFGNAQTASDGDEEDEADSLQQLEEESALETGIAETENAGEEEAWDVEDVRTDAEDETVIPQEEIEATTFEESDSTPMSEGGVLPANEDEGEADPPEPETGNGETENAGEEEAWDVEDVMTDAEDGMVADERSQMEAQLETASASDESVEEVPVVANDGDASPVEPENGNAETENAGEEEAWDVEDVMTDAEDGMVAGREEGETNVATERDAEEMSEASDDQQMKDTQDDELSRNESTATTTASNELVEEGLRRLKQRNGESTVLHVITLAMKRVLIEDLGYKPSEVETMRPDVAVVIVGESLARPDVETLPWRFYNDIDSAGDDKVVGNKLEGRSVASLLKRIKKNVSAVFGGKDPQTLLIVAASLGAALTAITHPVLERREQTVGVARSIETPVSDTSTSSDLSEQEDEEEFGEEDDTPSAPNVPGDLDETWLDKLISLVCKPFERMR